MLVQFRVKNFKCIKDEQIFSMVSNARNDFAFGSNHKAAPHLLPAAGIFGGNAAGKSTLLDAINILDRLFHMSADAEKVKRIKITPFLLDAETSKAPSEFEIVFIRNNKLYQYGCEIDNERIYREWLIMIPDEGRRNDVFHRQYDLANDSYEWTFNEKLVKGPKNSWRQATASNALFISVALNLNAQEHVEAFSDVSKWFRRSLNRVDCDQSHFPGYSDSYTAQLFLEKNEISDDVEAFLKRIGIDFSKISVTKVDETQFGFPENFPEALKMSFTLNTQFGHIGSDGREVFWGIGEESEGTKRLFKMLGYIMSGLKIGQTIIIDELHNHLHPFVLEEIINLFQDKETNPNRAQLIFTSHIFTPMDQNILAKDQIWLVEKNKNKACEVIPLSSFKELKDTGATYWKHYLVGKLGGIPPRRKYSNEK